MGHVSSAGCTGGSSSLDGLALETGLSKNYPAKKGPGYNEPRKQKCLFQSFLWDHPDLANGLLSGEKVLLLDIRFGSCGRPCISLESRRPVLQAVCRKKNDPERRHLGLRIRKGRGCSGLQVYAVVRLDMHSYVCFHKPGIF